MHSFVLFTLCFCEDLRMTSVINK